MVVLALITLGLFMPFNPFFAMDYSAGHGVEFDYLRWTLISFPIVALTVWCYWVLRQSKCEFHRRDLTSR